MSAFVFLYFFIVIYALAIRFASRKEVISGHVGWAYKLQAITAVTITALTNASVAFIFAQNLAEWIYQFIPTLIVAAIVTPYKTIN
jgi:lipoprotein signal peptidase